MRILENQGGSAQTSSQQEAGNSVTSDKTSSKSDQMFINVEGGSHLIAAIISDIYSPNFKQNLGLWLESVPEYPKPFDMTFQLGCPRSKVAFSDLRFSEIR